MTDFTAIKQLKLKEAFEGRFVEFSNIAEDNDYLNTLFELRKRHMIFVMDDNAQGHSVFVDNTNGIGVDRILTVNNNRRKNVFLWRIDGVLFDSESKCDCALITKDKLIFVEFKSNAVNNSMLQAQEEYEKAYSQLDKTFNDVQTACHRVGINIKRKVETSAIAVFNKTVPKFNSSIKTLSAKFLRKNKIKLSYDIKTTV